jgi:predicted O-methyltransferase YrrM
VIGWSVTAPDWEDLPASALVEQVESSWRPGSIVVMHDALYATTDPAYRDREPTLEAVATLLERHASRFRFVTVPELLAAGRPRYWPWFRRPDLNWLHRQV